MSAWIESPVAAHFVSRHFARSAPAGRDAAHKSARCDKKIKAISISPDEYLARPRSGLGRDRIGRGRVRNEVVLAFRPDVDFPHRQPLAELDQPRLADQRARRRFLEE